MTDAIHLHGFASRRAVSGDRSVHYAIAGDGPAVVLIHGLGGAASNWYELGTLLSRHFRVVAVDLPGHGGSEPPAAVRGLESLADAVGACLDQEEIRAAALVGHSLGGAVALRLAFRRPDGVSAIVLAAGAGISSTTLRAKAGLRTLGVVRPGRLFARRPAQVARRLALRRVVFRALVSDPQALSAASVYGFLAGSAAVSDSARAREALLVEDPRVELDRVGCPVLVLWGARDWFLPLEDAHEYARRLGAPLRVLPDTGHLLIAERPGECVRHIRAFLDGVGQVDELPGEVEPVGDRLR